ncbi:MAG: FKBP-type peptidyl-prolyl cis-trans isomerase [Candidatus Saccharimonadales bacterium]
MTKVRDRIFAGFGALLFLTTASALTIAVIVNAVGNHDSSKSEAAAANKATSCSSSAPIAAATLAVPGVFKPEGEVKALDKTDLEVGTGATLKSGDCVQVKYYGTLASDGTKFDENFTQPTAFQFQLGQGNVIQGWDQGLVGAKVGGTRRLVIPANLAYGNQAAGSIPANSALVFVVKILKVAN